MNRKVTLLAAALLSSLLTLNTPGTAWAQSAQPPQAWQLEAGPLDAALRRLGDQGRLTITYPSALVSGKTTPGLSGQYTLVEALEHLLAGTGLTWEFIGDDALVIKVAGTAPGTQAKPASQSRSEKEKQDEKVVGMPAIMVKGARTLNMDIERTADDPQPYVVFDRATIERAGAVNLNDFMKTRLPMNTSIRNEITGNSFTAGVNSNVNLRGLGDNQTLILIDGRRLAKSSNGFTLGQPDINGIPMEAIERIEVLPSTASAIYGGAATGGVINIIMRRDYVGTQVTLNYDNSFDTDTAIKRIDLSSGFSLFGGRTQVLLTGSYSESNDLLVKDRKFNQRGRENILANNPALYYPAFRPINGAGANIVSADGASLVMKDGSSLNSSFTYAPDGYDGIDSDRGAALLANAGTYAPGSIDSILPPEAALVASPLVKYLSASVRHEFSERLQGFVEASRSENTSHVRDSGDGSFLLAFLPASAPTNPFQQDVIVNTSSRQFGGYVDHENKSDRFSGGLVFQLPGQWMVATDYTYSKSKRGFLAASPYADDFILNSAYADGRVDLLKDLDTQDLSPYMLSRISSSSGPLQAITKNPAIRFSGPIGTLKSGRPRISVLLERQENEFGTSSDYAPYTLLPFTVFPERSQDVDSAYMEFQIPLLSSLNQISWVEELELQLAGRWDKYKSTNADQIRFAQPPSSPPSFQYVRNEFSEFSPLIAARFRPNGSLAFRMSLSEGFLPPDINRLTMPTTIIGRGNSIGTVLDPRRGNTPTSSYSTEIAITSGGNPDLSPEYSTTRSVGVIYTPRWLDGFRLSVDYTSIEKEGGITSFGYQSLLDNEEYFPDRVTRGSNLPTDPQGWAGPITALNTTRINSAYMKLQTYDVQVDYTLYTQGSDSISFYALATWQTRFDVQLLPTAPITDNLGWVSDFSAPMDLKGNLGVVWDSEPWTLGWTMRYASSYYVADPAIASSVPRLLAQGNGGRVPSQTYHDVFAKYKFASRARGSRASNLLDGLELQAGVRNLFGKAPPYDVSYSNTYYSPFGDPRLTTYYITLRQNF